MEYLTFQIIGIVIIIIGMVVTAFGFTLNQNNNLGTNPNQSNIPLMTMISRGKNYGQTRMVGGAKESYTNMGAPSYSLSNEKGSLNVINKASKVFGREDFFNMGNSQEIGFITRKSKGGHFKITMGIEKSGINKYYIEDLGSSNGTLLNNIDISNRGKVELRKEDLISPGGTFKIEFKITK